MGDPGIPWFPVLHGPDLGEARILFSSPACPSEPFPASLIEIIFHLHLFSLQGPEAEWELEVFPLTALVLGAFLASVSESEVFLGLAFPVSLSSMQGKQGWGRGLGDGVGEGRLGFATELRDELGESAGRVSSALGAGVLSAQSG